MKVLRWLAIGIGLVLLFLVLLGVAARFSDGPIAIFPGGPLQSGEWVEDPAVDWAFASDIQEIELESGGGSRTTWILVLDGEAYIPCSLDFPPGKSWHHNALKRPEAVVRIEGKRYRRRLEQVQDESIKQGLTDIVGEKYGGGPGGDASRIWFFRLAPAA
jgi:hypothetical protein